MKPTPEQIKDFFVSCGKMTAKLSTQTPSLLNYNEKNWQYRITPADLSKIFQWICDNETDITRFIQTFPYKVLRKHKETSLYLSFELITDDEGHIHLMLNSKSKRAASSTGERQKDPELTASEIKANKKKSKVIQHGSYKEVQYCYQWQAGMEDLSIYTCSIFKLKNKDALAETQQEKRFRDLLGKDFSNKLMIGSSKNDRKCYFYTPLAVSNQTSWSRDSSAYGLKGMNHISFLNVLYKQALILQRLQKSGVIWRDLKGENFLMVLNSSKNSLKPIPIDFSLARTTQDPKEKLRNDFGTLSYISPWHDYFIELRKLKQMELKYQNELDIEIKIINELNNEINIDRFDNLHSQIYKYKKAFSEQTKYLQYLYGDCIAVTINIIDSYTKIEDLKAATFYENKDRLFLASHRDDVWAFSKLMTELIAIRYSETKDIHLKAELKQIYDYFLENMKKPWQDIHTGEQIVMHLIKMFKTMNIEVIDNPVENKPTRQPPKVKLSLLNTKNTKEPPNKVTVKMPCSFIF